MDQLLPKYVDHGIGFGTGAIASAVGRRAMPGEEPTIREALALLSSLDRLANPEGWDRLPTSEALVNPVSENI
jgi:hypothetical protein